MTRYDYDLFTIGAGSGGTRASRLAAQLGARVAVAEEYRIGGTCVVRGCIPKKLLVYASEYPAHFKDAAGFGWTVEWARFDWAALRDNVQQEVSRLSKLYETNLAKAGAEIIEDRAEIIGPNVVHLVNSGRTVSAERILVATGGAVVRPTFKGGEHAITSEEAFLLDRLPGRVVVIGGGYIALEFAQIFHGLGVDTTVICRGERVLRGFDDELRAHVHSGLERAGVKIVTGALIQELSPAEDGYSVRLGSGLTIQTDLVLAAIGRAPNTAKLGLETAGVTLTDAGAVAVDAYSRSSAPSIFAIGDVTNRVNLTPVAIREAIAFVETEFRSNPVAMDYAHIPTAVFTQPPVGAVGFSESDARTHFGSVHIYKSDFRPMKNILAGNEQRTFMKLVVRASDGVVVGVHIAGADAPEIIQMAAIAVKAGLTKAQWDATVALHPTASEELVLLREKSA